MHGRLSPQPLASDAGSERNSILDYLHTHADLYAASGQVIVGDLLRYHARAISAGFHIKPNAALKKPFLGEDIQWRPIDRPTHSKFPAKKWHEALQDITYRAIPLVLREQDGSALKANIERLYKQLDATQASIDAAKGRTDLKHPVEEVLPHIHEGTKKVTLNQISEAEGAYYLYCKDPRLLTIHRIKNLPTCRIPAALLAEIAEQLVAAHEAHCSRVDADMYADAAL
ncbi:MAG: hypothetical protein AAGA36_00380 [Pseudomonadota bacterium]